MSWITHGLTAIAISVAAVSSTAAQNKIVIGTVGTGNTLEWPLYIAEKKGYFDQEKFALEWVGVQSSAAVMQQLAAGSLNLGTTGLADALRAPDKGAPTRLLRIGVGVSPYEAIGARTVKSWTDLRQKTVMIGGAKDITRVYFEDIAKPNGLAAGEYDYVFAGSDRSPFFRSDERFGCGDDPISTIQFPGNPRWLHQVGPVSRLHEEFSVQCLFGQLELGSRKQRCYKALPCRLRKGR